MPIRHRRAVPVLEALTRQTDEYQRRLLIDGYRDLANEVRELCPLANHPNPLAPRLTKRLVLLETLSGHTPPAGVLTVRDVLAIARRRGQG